MMHVVFFDDFPTLEDKEHGHIHVDNQGRLVIVDSSLPIDGLSESVVTVDFAEHELHEGDSFTFTTSDLTMSNGETIIIAFKTPISPKRVHLLASFATAAGGHLEFIEGMTWAQGTGAQEAILNRKRESSMNSSGLRENQGQAEFTASDTMIVGATSLAGGSVLHTDYAFGTKQSPAGVRGNNEWILKPDTTYVFRFTADGNSNGGWVELSWYEHADSNG